MIFNKKKNHSTGLNFSDSNLSFIRLIIFITIFLSFLIQIFLIKKNDEMYVVFFQFFSNSLVFWYCLNKKNLFEYPVSISVIFFFNIFCSGGAFFFKTFFLESLSKNLSLPFDTFLFLFLCNIYLIVSHIIYKNISFFHKFRSFLSDILVKLKVNQFNTKEPKFLFFLGYFSILLPFVLTFFFNDASNNILVLTRALVVFSNVPILILFLYKDYYLKNTFFYINIIILIGLFMFTSLSVNSRSGVFDFFSLIIIITILRILFGYIKLNTYTLFKYILSIPFLILLIFIFENISNVMLQSRAYRAYFTTTETLKYFSDNFTVFEMNRKSPDLFVHDLFPENYYKISIMNRINIINYVDNIIYSEKYLIEAQISSLKDFEINKIISIAPNPFLAPFVDKFSKEDYTTSIASKVYLLLDPDYAGNLSFGSMFAILKMYYGYYFFLFFLPFLILQFSVVDSFFIKNQFSPILLFSLWSTSAGFLNSLLFSSFSTWALFFFRTVPQSIILYIVLFYLYKIFFIKK